MVRELETTAGDDLYSVLVEAVRLTTAHEEPIAFDFNSWHFETVVGETLEQAKVRLQGVVGFDVLTPEENAAAAKKRVEDMERESAEAIAAAGVATELEMRELDPPRCETIEELTKYIATLVDRPHDYGTCVYAMALAARAAKWYVAGKLGATGFQAGGADMSYIKGERRMECFGIQDYGNLLFPQYCDEEHFPSAKSLMKKEGLKKWLGEQAVAKLAEIGFGAHPDVVSHWKMLAESAGLEFVVKPVES